MPLSKKVIAWIIIMILLGFGVWGIIPKDRAVEEARDQLEQIDIDEPADLVFGDREVLVIYIDGHYFPESQFEVWDNPNTGCSYPHYRAGGNRLEAFGFEDYESQTARIIADAGESGCGYGLYDNFERANIQMSEQQYKIFIEYITSAEYK